MDERARIVATRIRKRRLRQYSVAGVSVATVALTGLTWWLLTSGLGVIEPLFFPSPAGTLQAADSLGSRLAFHSVATLIRVIGGLAIGTVAGVAIGVVMTWNRWLRAIIEPLVEIIRPIPPIALAPFFILWFGLSESGRILLIALGTAVVMVVQTWGAINNIPPLWREAAGCLGANTYQSYRTVVLPAIMSSLVDGIRISAASAWALDIAAEFLGAQTGLGYVILNARRTLDTSTVLVTIVIIGLLAFVLDIAIRSMGRAATLWRE